MKLFKCPINYFTEKLIFNADGSCWGVFSLKGYGYDFLSIKGKISILHRLTRYLSAFLSESQMLIIPMEQNNKEHFKRLKDSLDKEDPLYERTLNYTNLTEEYLQNNSVERGLINDYKTYVCVKLESGNEIDFLTNKIKDGFQQLIKDPINAINVYFNLDTKDILERKLKSYMKAADKWFEEQNERIEMYPCDEEEIQWLLRRIQYRGTNIATKLRYQTYDRKQKWVPHSQKIDVGEIAIRPLKRDVVNLFSGSIKVNGRVITVINDKTVSYQTFLVITHVPDETTYPGMEWIYMLQSLNTQAEVCISTKTIEHRKALETIDKKKQEIDQQIKNIQNAKGKIPEDLLESSEYADAMEAELKKSKFPILETSIVLCFAADSIDLLEQKVNLVKNEYEDMDFIVERPIADQLKLFMQTIPSVGITVKDFVMPLSPIKLAGSVIGATHELGDNEGPFIGTTGEEEKNVFLNMALACLKNKSASATFFGDLGYGKSFNANLLVLLNVLFGGYGLIFDPKGERTHWYYELKILEGFITTVTLSSEPEYKGKLDPYNIYRNDVNVANELAINIIAEWMDLSSSSLEYTALLEAAKRIKTEETKSMEKLFDILDTFEQTDELYNTARFMARRLRLQAEAGMSQLLIGDGTEEPIQFTNRLNILQIQNLKLPSMHVKKEEYTVEEKLSNIIMTVLSHFAKNFALMKLGAFKLIEFDESWMLKNTSEGIKMYDFLSRMGRSLFTGCIFNGHSVLDIPTETIRNTITYKFCFHTDSEEEAGRMLEYLKLENTAENRNILLNMENGSCLFQDLDGHVGILKFDAVFQDIIDVFSTTPKKKQKTKEQQQVEDKSIQEDEIIVWEESLPEELDLILNELPDDLLDSIDIYEREEI